MIESFSFLWKPAHRTQRLLWTWAALCLFSLFAGAPAWAASRFSITQNVTVAEGATATFRITRTDDTPADASNSITINVTSSGVTATSGVDFNPVTPNSVTFAPGQTIKQVTVATVQDTLKEENETFTVDLNTSDPNAVLTVQQGTGTIIDDDPVPTVTLSEDQTVNEGSPSVTFRVFLSNASGQEIRVNYTTSNQEAISGQDYTATSGQLIFAPGDTEKTITIPIINDAQDETSPERFFFTISGATNSSITRPQAVVSIIDNDGPTISINDVQVTEGQTAVFTVSLSAPATEQVRVNVTTQDFDAVAGSDYTPIVSPPLTLIFNPGERTKTVNVITIDDNVDEGDPNDLPERELFFVNLSSPQGAGINGANPITDTQGIGTILDNDTPPSISIADSEVLEGNAGTSQITFTLTLSNRSEKNISVQYQSSVGGPAPAQANDFQPAIGTVTFAPGEMSRQITLLVNGDTAIEPNETFVVNLSNPVNVSINDGQAVGTIRDDDTRPGVTISDVALTEGPLGASRTFTFKVSLTSATSNVVSVRATTQNSSAQAGVDYTALSQDIVFAAGDTEEDFNVTVIGDDIDELNETFLVSLTNLTGETVATIADAQAIGTIIDDDEAPTLTIAGPTTAVPEGDTGFTPAVFTVTLSAQSDRPVTVQYTTQNGTANASQDYNAVSGTLTIPVGQTSGTITVDVIGDTLYENGGTAETFNVTLFSPTNAIIGTPTATATINDTDLAPPIPLRISPDRGYADFNGDNGVIVLIEVSSLAGLRAVYFDDGDGNSATPGVRARIDRTDNNPNPKQIYAEVPVGARSGPITLEYDSGFSTGGNFRVLPVITDFSPRRGVTGNRNPVYLGTEVTITGRNFIENGVNNVSDILFGGQEISRSDGSGSFRVVNDTTIIANVPQGATSGPITVRSPFTPTNGPGTGGLASRDTFIVDDVTNASIAVSRFTPNVIPENAVLPLNSATATVTLNRARQNDPAGTLLAPRRSVKLTISSRTTNSDPLDQFRVFPRFFVENTITGELFPNPAINPSGVSELDVFIPADDLTSQFRVQLVYAGDDFLKEDQRIVLTARFESQDPRYASGNASNNETVRRDLHGVTIDIADAGQVLRTSERGAADPTGKGVTEFTIRLLNIDFINPFGPDTPPPSSPGNFNPNDPANREGEKNIDARPKADVLVTVQSTDTSEGLPSYFVQDFDNDGNGPDTAQGVVAIQPIPVQSGQQIILFSVDVTSPEFYRNPHIVRVTGVDDPDADGDVIYGITTESVVSSDREYDQLNASRFADTVRIVNTDDETNVVQPGQPAFLFTSGNNQTTPSPNAPSTDNLTTNESGSTAVFTVRLNTQPTANVTFRVRSDDITEGLLVDPVTGQQVEEVTFIFTPNTPPQGSAANVRRWDVQQTITIKGQDDTLRDGDQDYILLTSTQSADPVYNQLDPPDPVARNRDNEAAGVTVLPTLLTIDEGASRTFTVVLNLQPTSDVIINLRSSDTSRGRIDKTRLTFTPINWDQPQTVTVTATDDIIDNADQQFTIEIDQAISSDPQYSTQNPTDVTVFRLNNDFAGFTVTPVNGLVTTEAGGTATFTVRLNSVPTANVTIPFTSSNTTEGRVSAPGQTTPSDSVTLTFTPANFSTPQTVTVTGQDDPVQDGDQPYQITSGSANSTDSAYNSLRAANVNAVNRDDEVPGVRITPARITTTEAGDTATFSVRLNVAPTQNVTIRLRSNNTAEGRLIDPATGQEDTDNQVTLAFTPANFATSQVVTVRGVDDLLRDGDVNYIIFTDPTVSTDARYNGIDPTDVAAVNVDNEVPQIIVAPTAVTVSESGSTATFTIQLGSPPSAPVTINLRSNNTAEATVSPTSVTFDQTNFNVAQTITVTGVDDDIDDGDTTATRIITDPAVSNDSNYNGINPPNVAVTVRDNELPGIRVNPAAIAVAENVGTTTFTVRLITKPAAGTTVSIPVVSSQPSRVTVNRASLTFDETNYTTPQTVIATVIDDAIDNDGVVNINLGPATSTDPNYSGRSAVVPITITDNDTVGVTIAPATRLRTTEAGGTATFMVRLNSQPTQAVRIVLRSNTPTEGLLSTESQTTLARTASLTFTVSNYNVAQTVTITGQNDFIDDGNVDYAIVTDPATSNDTLYNNLDAADVPVVNVDDDTRGITVTPTSGLVTTEAGTFATFSIVLTSQPTTDVQIFLRSDDLSEGKPTVGFVIFTPANWNRPRQVTVKGLDDKIADGNRPYNILTLPASSSDLGYHKFNAADVALVNMDNDRAGIALTPRVGLTTSESGSTVSPSIRLLSEPLANVTITFTSNDTTEGTVFPSSVTFTPGTPPSGSPANIVKWNTAFRVTITGEDDTEEDAHRSYRILTSAAASSDPNYNGRDVPDLNVRNLDNDDKTAPAVAITNPRNGAAYRQISQVTGTASDQRDPNLYFVSGIRNVQVQLFRNDDPATTQNEAGYYNPATGNYEPQENQSTQLIPATYNTSARTWSANLPTSGTPASLPAGSYRVRAFATDNAGNRAETAQVAFVVDATVPTVTITTPTEGASVNSLPQVRGTATDNTSGSGIDRVEVVVFRYADTSNGVSEGFLAPDGSFRSTSSRLTARGSVTDGVYNYTFGLPSLVAARYYVRAFAIDRAGNQSEAAVRTFTIRGSGGDEFTGDVTYFISVPFMDSSAVNATTTPSRAFSVPPVDPFTGEQNYILQRYNPQSLQYENIGNGGVLRRGEGYLLRPVKRGTRILRPSEDPTRKPLASTIREFQVILRNNPSVPAREGNNGYNLIGDPFDPATYSAADWQNARVTATVNGQTFNGTVQEAANRQILDARLFTFNETSGEFEPTTGPLLPFRGYFVRTFTDAVQVNLRAIQ